MYQFEEICRPVIFENEDAKFTYWGKGSSFLISNSNDYFLVTAAHVLLNVGGHAKNIRILPSDNSQISLPFNQQYGIEKITIGDDDYKDILMLRIDLGRFDMFGDTSLSAQSIEHVISAENLKMDDELWVIGYPAEKSLVDYRLRKIKSSRSVIRAVYRGRSVSDHCHSLAVDSSINLENYDGLSGSPIFCMKATIYNGEEIDYPVLVGMLLRGTASSRIGHFVSADVIARMVGLVEKNR